MNEEYTENDEIDLTTLEGRKTYFNKIRDEMFEIYHPVSSGYVQYPGCLSPSEMGWRGTWEKQFADEGCIFTTEGNGAEEFNGSGQKFQMYTFSKNIDDEENEKPNRRSMVIWKRIA